MILFIIQTIYGGFIDRYIKITLTIGKSLLRYLIIMFISNLYADSYR